ncbi:MAG: FAD-binding protein [Bacteroidales bacterium]|nr:FAD-binding protein [Bacteroidales bacterium]
MTTIELTLTPEELFLPAERKRAAARHLRLREEEVAFALVAKRSLDARRGVKYRATLEVGLQGETPPEKDYAMPYQDTSGKAAVVIVGAGPAGLFAALQCLQRGLRPVIVERGYPVEQRKRDIARMARDGKANLDSNWCFGEGGAGTYSDGKLYTRSTKRGDVGAVLKQFVLHGADPEIMVDAHGHIGTDKLSGIIARIRNTIEGHGGEYHFGCRVTDFVLREGTVRGVRCQDGSVFEGTAVVLATGHSARDIYRLFEAKGWPLQQKPFAMGVRVEHPQQLINQIQYHSLHPSPLLPPATYNLSTQVEGHGVFSFCMCPGGVIVPAATAEDELVTNGMSDSHRSSPFANSGIAVTIAPEDVPEYAKKGPLGLMLFQQDVERKMFSLSNSLNAPGQRLTDFCESRLSRQLDRNNYLGASFSAPLHDLLPPFVVRCLQQGFRNFDQKMRGFYTSQATLFAVESRTSSPVRIPRGNDMQHPTLRGLFPCGEGAGYAGGIVSSAIDGINVIEHIANCHEF